MSKRRRDRTPNLPPDAFNAPLASAAPKVAVAGDAVATAVARKSVLQTVIDWKSGYGEVLSDLRRTFVIFALLVVAMLALSFVIR